MVKEGVGDCGVVRDEPTIEIGKAKEGSYILNFGWGRPGGNVIKFDRVHSELSRFHNHSKVFDFRDIELAFLKLQMEVKLGHPLEDTVGSFNMGHGIGGGNEEVILQ